jgi:hypothetical protein
MFLPFEPVMNSLVQHRYNRRPTYDDKYGTIKPSEYNLDLENRVRTIHKALQKHGSDIQ